MIQKAFITLWGTVVPWSSPRLVEQDLITCRALVSIFRDLLPSTARSTGMVTPTRLSQSDVLVDRTLIQVQFTAYRPV